MQYNSVCNKLWKDTSIFWRWWFYSVQCQKQWHFNDFIIFLKQSYRLEERDKFSDKQQGVVHLVTCYFLFTLPVATSFFLLKILVSFIYQNRAKFSRSSGKKNFFRVFILYLCGNSGFGGRKSLSRNPILIPQQVSHHYNTTLPLKNTTWLWFKNAILYLPKY